MKLYEKYKILKYDYKEYIVLIKKGTFYTTYANDSYILNYLFEYHVSDNSVGFPINSIEKVLKRLKNEKINVYLEDKNKKIEFKNNRYQEILFLADKNYHEYKKCQILLEEINYLLKSNPENICKLRNFINEL